MKNKSLIIAFALATSMMSAELSLAHKANNPETSYRRHTMKAAGGHEKALHLLLHPFHLAPFPEQKKMHIQALQETFYAMPMLFKKQGNYQDSDAKPNIWLEWERFEGLINRGKKILKKMAHEPDQKMQYMALKQLRNTCDDCHEYFRE